MCVVWDWVFNAVESEIINFFFKKKTSEKKEEKKLNKTS